MRKRLLVTAVGLGSSLALVVMPMARAGTAGGQGAQKRGLFPLNESGKCDPSGKPSPSSPNGFAILNAPGKVGAIDNIVGEVSLKDAPPNTTYTVELSMGSNNCMMQGMITTNGQGNANFHIQSPGTAGQYYVVLRSTPDGSKSFATDTVSLI